MMDTPVVTNPEYDPTSVTVKIEGIRSTPMHAARDAAQNLQITAYVDLTNEEEDKCFVCNCELITSEKILSLAFAKTNATKIPIAEKLGEIMGDRCIIVVSDKDYICRDCLKLVNRLDTIESEANRLRTKALKNLRKTYFASGKVINVLPGKVYKKLKNC